MRKRFLSCFMMLIMTIGILGSPTLIQRVQGAEEIELQNQEPKFVVAGDLQEHFIDIDENSWNPGSEKTQMQDMGNGIYEFRGVLPAGSYEYKITHGSWDESYGQGFYANPDGDYGENGNIKITVDEEQEVLFYYNPKNHRIADSTFYTPIQEENRPRIVGDIQPAIQQGEAWSPEESKAYLYDDTFEQTYTYMTYVPEGSYEYKIVLGNSWGEEYPGQNAKLDVLENTEITFYYNHNTKEVYTDYRPKGENTDGVINKSKLYHNTWDLLYRTPFGAVSRDTEVTLRLQAEKGDLTRARVYLKNYQTGNAYLHPMTRVGWISTTQGEMDFWETRITLKEIGTYGYKFLVGDQNAQVEYGEDHQKGGFGEEVDQNAGLFQLTVYDPSYQTPDWMKEAVVYQIFPDRFYNGNRENDTAKSNARGAEPIEHREWSQLPDHPRLKENEQDPTYDGDGIWGNDFFGGDIAGIHQKLDYIQSLGVNTLYLNPIAYAASNHKYDATDFKTLDPMFGTEEEFLAFTEELKKRGMHLIIDGVFNHVGDDSIYFDRYGKYETVGAYEYWSRVYDKMNDKGMTQEEAEAQAKEEFNKEGQQFSEYGFHHWFHIENEKMDVGLPTERYKYQCWWGFDSLPEFKSMTGEEAMALGLATKTNVKYASEYNNQKLVDYIFKEGSSVAKSWLLRGATGWRLDVANEVDPEFWREFRKELKDPSFQREIGCDPLILGEIWDDASQYFLGDQYDSVMNYRFRGALLDFLKNGNAENINESLISIQEDYPPEAFYALMNLMGSHDVARAAFLLGNGTDTSNRAERDKGYNKELGFERLKLAAIFQMGYPGAPTIYYGDEAGVIGSADPDCRRTYPWEEENKDLVEHFQQVGQVRVDHKGLFAYGDLFSLYAQGDVYVYGRKYGDEAAIIAINRGNTPQDINLDIKSFLCNGIDLTDALDSDYIVTAQNEQLSIHIPKMQGRMLITNSDQSLEPPTVVTNVQVTEENKKVILTWTGNQEAVSYRIYQSTIQGAGYEKVEEVVDTYVEIENLMNGRSYYFAITAVDVNGNESMMCYAEEAIPHFDLSSNDGWWSGNMTGLSDAVLDLSKTNQVSAQIWIGGETEGGLAEGLVARLAVKELNDTDWTWHEARYERQDGNNNVFTASWIPLEEGTFLYKMEFSTDGGRHWYTNGEEPKQVTFTKDSEDTTPPAQEITLLTPEVESGQVHLQWSITLHPEDLEDGPYLFQVYRDEEDLEDLWDIQENEEGIYSFIDFEVVNGNTYHYFIRVYDKAGNFIDSNTIEVTPELVMVAVTFKVKGPEDTPLDTRITIPNSLNGWNTGAWEMSRGGAVTPDWQYTVEVQEGTEITYKYVKAGSWDQEGLAHHRPYKIHEDKEDISYYGVGKIGTDLKVVIQNQGGNKMTIQDYILRWVDMPIVITTPQNHTTVSKDNITIAGNAIKGSILTIKGELDEKPIQVEVNEDMNFSHLLKLKEGENKIQIHIEPTEESKRQKFENDGEAIAKNTKELTFTIHYKKEKEEIPVDSNPGPSSDQGSPLEDIKIGHDTKNSIKEAQQVIKEMAKNYNDIKEKPGEEAKEQAKQLKDQSLFIAQMALQKTNTVNIPSTVQKDMVNGTVGIEIINEVQKSIQKTEEMEGYLQEVGIPVSLKLQSIVPIRITSVDPNSIKKCQVSFDANVFKQMKQPVPLMLDTPVGKVIITKETLGKKVQEASQIQIVLERLEEDPPFVEKGTIVHPTKVLDLQIYRDGQLVEQLEHPVKVCIPYPVKGRINQDFVAVFQIQQDNQIVKKAGYYDDRRQEVRFTTMDCGRYFTGITDAHFRDIKNYPWAQKEILAMGAKGIIIGKEDEFFAPEDFITRAEIAVLMVRMLNLQDPTAKVPFTDIQEDAWYSKAIGSVYQAGFMEGMGKDTFAPDAPITREELAKIISKALQQQGYVLEGVEGLESFLDQEVIAPWAKMDLSFLVKEGIIKGKEEGRMLAPKDKATRAEAAVLLYKAFELLFLN